MASNGMPGTMDQAVADALDVLEAAANDLRERFPVCAPVVSRLRVLSSPPRVCKFEEQQATQYLAIINTAVRAFKATNVGEAGVEMRIASSRVLLERVNTLHHSIDTLALEIGLGNDGELHAWRESWGADIEEAARRFAESVSTSAPKPKAKPSADASEQKIDKEGPSALRYEYSRHINDIPQPIADVMAALLARPMMPASVPSGFVGRYELSVRAESIGRGFLGEVYEAEWGPRGAVAIKCFLVGPDHLQSAFRSETATLLTLDHPFLLKMYGASHVGQPLFTVLERTTRENLKTYAPRDSSFWQLVYEAAQALVFLHEQGKVHGAVRCENVLVGMDGHARLSDACFIAVRRMTASKSLNAEDEIMRWKAPELVLSQNGTARLDPLVDAYGLGLAVIEAVTQLVPWQGVDNEGLFECLYECQETTGSYPRPAGAFTDAEWSVLERLTMIDDGKRASVADVLGVLAELANICRCGPAASGGAKFCGQCGCRVVLATKQS